MVRPSRRSHTLRKIFKRIPSGISKIFYKKRKNSKLLCTECKKELHGISPKIQSKLRNTTKSKKRPERKYGGVLCPACTKRKIINETRK